MEAYGYVDNRTCTTPACLTLADGSLRPGCCLAACGPGVGESLSLLECPQGLLPGHLSAGPPGDMEHARIGSGSAAVVSHAHEHHLLQVHAHDEFSRLQVLGTPTAAGAPTTTTRRGSAGSRLQPSRAIREVCPTSISTQTLSSRQAFRSVSGISCRRWYFLRLHPLCRCLQRGDN